MFSQMQLNTGCDQNSSLSSNHSEKVKVKSTMLHKSAHLPLLDLEPVGGEPLMSVTRGQCDARPTVIFPTTRHHHPLAGTTNYTAW